MAYNDYDISLAGGGGGSDFLARPMQSNDFLKKPGMQSPNLELGGGMKVGSTDGLDLNKTLGAPGGGFDWGSAMGNFSMGAQGVMGLANAYTAYKQLGLMEDQLSMQGEMANRNIANQALTTNRMLEDRASLAAQLTTGAEYGTEEHLAAQKKLQTTVSGDPIV